MHEKTVHGFTLIELLVVMSIIGILFGIGIAQYMNFNRRQILDQAAQELKSNLRLAQNKALAGEKQSGWCASPNHLRGYQLRFNSTQNYLIEAVCSDGSTRQVKSTALPSSVTKSGSTSVLFKVLAQGVETEASFALSGYGEPPQTVTVTKTGEIR